MSYHLLRAVRDVKVSVHIPYCSGEYEQSTPRLYLKETATAIFFRFTKMSVYGYLRRLFVWNFYFITLFSGSAKEMAKVVPLFTVMSRNAPSWSTRE